MKIRIKFSKQGHMRFIGHLDLQRFFQKVMRRAQIPIRFSEGMSPHMIMSFASPLGVGLTSIGEYIDIEVTDFVSSKDALERINAVLPEGLSVLEWRQLPEEKTANAMASVAGADYVISFREGCQPDTDAWLEQTGAFLQQPKILVEKENKKALKKAARRGGHRKKEAEAPVPVTVETDIRPLIEQMEADPDGRCIRVRVACGSAANLKPDALMDAYLAFCHLTPKPFSYAIERRELYALKQEEGEKAFVPLSALGRVI